MTLRSTKSRFSQKSMDVKCSQKHVCEFCGAERGIVEDVKGRRGGEEGKHKWPET